MLLTPVVYDLSEFISQLGTRDNRDNLKLFLKLFLNMADKCQQKIFTPLLHQQTIN